MSKLIRLSKSGIEWLRNPDGSAGYVWNFYSGCRHKEQGVCPVPHCWAESQVRRFKKVYPNGFKPTFYSEAFLSPFSLKKPSRIGVCFMGDLFGDWVDPEEPFQWVLDDPGDGDIVQDVPLRRIIFEIAEFRPQHTFIFLTKAPWNYKKWGKFPDNCWLGFTACTRRMLLKGCTAMRTVEARVKFVSIEPMLEDTWCLSSTLALAGIKWVIIGAQTRPKKLPEWEWVKDLIELCDQLDIKVFLKNNLGLPKYTDSGAVPFYKKDDTGVWKLRQELPY